MILKLECSWARFTSIKKQEMQAIYVVDAAFPDRSYVNGIEGLRSKSRRPK